MTREPWLISTPKLDVRGDATAEVEQFAVDPGPFARRGWRHVVLEHFDQSAWDDAGIDGAARGRLFASLRADPDDPARREAVDSFLRALHFALERAASRPRFITTHERGYLVSADDIGRSMSIFERKAIEERRGIIGVDDSGLVLIVSGGVLATAYFPDTTSHLSQRQRLKEAMVLVRRRACLGGYHDSKYDRYWCRVGDPEFHDRTSWASKRRNRPEKVHGSE